jgi:DNA-binding winged helix-turn-helix (wHTH) protein/tetratricopeptide (TPR) repeat protein
MSGETHQINLPPIRLDLKEGRLWNGERPVDLRPKTWELIRYMVERPGKLLSKQELIDAVWPDTIVTEASLNQAIRELRKALGDDARKPKFIETVHRRGFRFIEVAAEPAQAAVLPPAHARALRPQLFGRQQELAQLHEQLTLAKTGKRQFLFVTGEPGIGKTSLVRTFLDDLVGSLPVDNPSDSTISVGWGQCIDQHGESEPNLPFLEAIDRLARGPRGERVRQSLKHYAPTWFVQFSWMLEPEHSFEQQLIGATPARMLREFCVFVEALAAEVPLILWLEDLHWSNAGTIDLLDALARREENARLFVIASYRPVDAALSGNPVPHLKQSLLQQNLAVELALELLGRTAVAEYLTSRFDKLDSIISLTDLVVEQTDGNPLFVITLNDYLVANGLLEQVQDQWKLTAPFEAVCAECPKSLKDIVELQRSAANKEEISLLDAASVVGTGFDSQAVAGALELDVDTVETVFGGLAKRGQFLTPAGTANWPDGSLGQRYEFIHDVFRSTMYDALAPGRRQRLHRNIAIRLTRGFAGQHERVAAEMALHSELGGDPVNAITWLILAADRAQRRSAALDSITYLNRALEQIESLPEGQEKEEWELKVRLRMMRALISTAGYTTVQQDPQIARVLELCDRFDDKSRQLLVLAFQSGAQILRGSLAAARRSTREARSIARQVSDPVLLSHEFLASGIISLVSGELKKSEEQFQQCIAFLDETDLREPSKTFGHDPAVLAMGFSSLSAWCLGLPDEARKRAENSLRRAEAIGAAQNKLLALDLCLSVEQFRRDVPAARSLARTFKSTLEKYLIEFPYMRPITARNWLVLQDGESEKAVNGLIRDIATAREKRARLFSCLSITTLAEAHLANGTIAEGLAAADEALDIADGGERIWEAETYRVKGELLRKINAGGKAEECFRKSVEVAASQSALALELRGATSLAKLLADSGRDSEAGPLLENTLGRFTEGFETADWHDANSLLNTL